MKVELLVTAGCLNQAPAWALLQDCMAALGIASKVIETTVDTPEQAQILGFPGSPTVRVNDQDVEPGFMPVEGAVACRTYRVDGRVQGVPDRSWVLEALRKAQEADLRHCCSRDPVPNEGSVCPRSGTPGMSVTPVTVRAMLKSILRDQVHDEAYRFCNDPTCDIVYFKTDGSQVFTKTDLAIRVGIKESQPPRPLCYCYGHSFESIRDEWSTTGRTTVIESIKAQMKAGACRCEVTNPSGACCLGDIIKALKEIQGVSALPATSQLKSPKAVPDCCHMPANSKNLVGSQVWRADSSKECPDNRQARLPVIPDWTVATAPAAREAIAGILDAAWQGTRFADLDASAVRVLVTLLRLYADLGKPPSRQRIAAETAMAENDVLRLLNELDRHDLVIVNHEDWTVRGAYPFTEAVTGHTITFTRTQRILNTMCFVDALGAAAMCREDAVVRSACRTCGVPIIAGMRDSGMTLGEVQPPNTAVWVGFRASCGCAADSLCREMIPFCCNEHLERWKASEHVGDGRRLTVEEATQVGKSLFADRALRSHE